MTRRRACALGLTSASLVLGAFVGCGGDDAARPPPVVPAPTIALPVDAASAPVQSGYSTSIDAGPDPALPRAPRTPREVAYGQGSAKPGDPHPFRIAIALRAARANRSGASILSLVSALPDVVDAKARTGVDPFADGEWLLVYGADIGIPGANANVVRHTRPDSEVASALGDAGFAAFDGGPPNSVRGVLYNVSDIVVRPQPGVLAMVPEDRANELARMLERPIDVGVKASELARGFVAEPALEDRVVRVLPKNVTHANLLVKPAVDGGLDFAVDAECGDVAQCTATANDLGELVTRSNSMLVRMVSHGLLSGLVIRADGTRLKATLHASPEQVESLVALVRAQLGLPPATK